MRFIRPVSWLVLFSLTACSGNMSRHPHSLSTDPAMSFHLVKIYKPDGSIQCEQEGVGADKMMQTLTANGIHVVCAQKGDTGMMTIALCGASTTVINVYSINPENLVRAQELGFKSVDELPDYLDTECQQ